MKGNGILKTSKKNLPITTNVEINPKNEDIDFLLKFKDSKKKIEKELNEGQNNNNKNKSTNTELRKSTLKNGILFEKEKDTDLYDNEEKNYII